jgi:hypothetical protein
MNENITSADISMSGYKSFEEFNKELSDAVKSIPNGFCDISANVYVTYPSKDDGYEYNLRNIISVDTSTIEEAISELRKLSKGNYNRITLDVILEKSHNGPKECHTCIYSSGSPRTS